MSVVIPVCMQTQAWSPTAFTIQFVTQVQAGRLQHVVKVVRYPRYY